MIAQSIIDRLHRVFDKSPQLTAAIQITGTGTALVAGQTLTIGGQSITLTGKTLGAVATEISLLAGYTATAVDPTAPAEHLWADRGIPLPGVLSRPSSLLWAEIGTYGRELDRQWLRLQARIGQVYWHAAQGTWLDRWCRYFGISRAQGEADQDLLKRTIETILAIKCNAIAMELAVFKATGLQVGIRNMVVEGGVLLTNTVTSLMNQTRLWGAQDNRQIFTFGVYINKGPITLLSEAEKRGIKSVIDSNKAGGVQAVYYVPSGRLLMNEPTTIMNDANFTVGPALGGWATTSL